MFTVGWCAVVHKVAKWGGIVPTLVATSLGLLVLLAEASKVWAKGGFWYKYWATILYFVVLLCTVHACRTAECTAELACGGVFKTMRKAGGRTAPEEVQIANRFSLPTHTS
jgi:hypothetical protein